MNNIALYGHWICPFATRVEFALHQRGIGHDLIDLPPSAVRGSDFVLPDEFIVEPDAIEQASDALADALAEMGRWTTDTGWLAGTASSLAEAVAMPIHVRMAGLQRLGFTGELTAEWSAHGERCRSLAGWPSVEWSTEQTDEFVGRFEAFRRKRRSQNASRS